MRKVIITTHTDLAAELLPPTFFERVESIEGKALLKLDAEQGVKIAVCDITVKDGFTLKDLSLPDEWTILDVLKESTNVYTCVLKTEYTRSNKKVQTLLKRREYAELRELFTSDIFIDLPFTLSEETVVMSFTADNETIKKFLQYTEVLGEIKSIAFQPATFSEYNILSCLTERQKEVITTAKKSGYYELPRKTTTDDLSKKLGISAATTIEHLRKAENRIISFILAGHL